MQKLWLFYKKGCRLAGVLCMADRERLAGAVSWTGADGRTGAFFKAGKKTEKAGAQQSGCFYLCRNRNSVSDCDSCIHGHFHPEGL